MPDASFAVLFLRPDAPQSREDTFDLEALALEELGIDSAWASAELAIDAPEEALSHIEDVPGRRWLLRSWMLNEENYTAFYEAVEARGETLMVEPEAYAEAMHFPESYPHIEGQTPQSTWSFGESIDGAWEAAQALGNPPYFLKDHIKSAKEEGDLAMFVPDLGAGTKMRFYEVAEALRDFRGEHFCGGFVIRQWTHFALLPGSVDAQGACLPDEHRCFFHEGRLLAQAPYHDAEVHDSHGAAACSGPAAEELKTFAAALGRFASPLLAVDVARLQSGDWTIVEVSDASVAALPPLMDPRELYRALRRSV